MATLNLGHGAMATYVLAPFVGWVVAGSLKFAINSVRSRQPAWREIGYGGIPSTHTAIVSTTALLIGLREGWNTPMFAVAATLGLVVVLDAMSLRRQIGFHARLLNSLLKEESGHENLRERLGHHWTEVLTGLLVGWLCAVVLRAIAR